MKALPLNQIPQRIGEIRKPQVKGNPGPFLLAATSTGLLASPTEYALGRLYKGATGKDWYVYKCKERWTSPGSIPVYSIMSALNIGLSANYMDFMGYEKLGDMKVSDWGIMFAGYGFGTALVEEGLGRVCNTYFQDSKLLRPWIYYPQQPGSKDRIFKYTSGKSVIGWGIAGCLWTIMNFALMNFFSNDASDGLSGRVQTRHIKLPVLKEGA